MTSREVLSYFLSCKFFYYKGQRGSPQCSASCCSLHLRRDCHMICFIAPKANNHIVDASIITALNLPATKLFKIRFAVVVFFRFRYRERSTNALRFVVAFGCSRISGVHIEKVITQRRERKPISPCPRGHRRSPCVTPPSWTAPRHSLPADDEPRTECFKLSLIIRDRALSAGFRVHRSLFCRHCSPSLLRLPHVAAPCLRRRRRYRRRQAASMLDARALPTLDRLSTFELRISNCEFRIANCELRVSNFKFQLSSTRALRLRLAGPCASGCKAAPRAASSPFAPLSSADAAQSGLATARERYIHRDLQRVRVGISNFKFQK